MFPKSPNPTTASSQAARSEYYSAIQNNDPRLAELSDVAIGRASLHRLEQAALVKSEEALIDLDDEGLSLSRGWLNAVNDEARSTDPEQNQLDDQWASEAKFHEPTSAERAEGAAVESIIQITPYLRSVRLSQDTQKRLAGMRPADFDLAA